MQRRRTLWPILTAMSIVFTAGCSSTSSVEEAAQRDAVDGVVSAPGAEEPVFSEREAVTAIDDQGEPVEPVTESLAPVAETGVPGIESEDGFCRAWSAYAGSVRALALAWTFQAPVDAARLEVAATAAITRAVDTMAGELPVEIESNRQELTVDVPGPFLRRAERARRLLVDAGMGEDQIDALAAAWIAAITEQGIESETLVIDVTPDSVVALDTAAEAFASELPSVVEDPSLDTTEFDITLSLAYISVTCPDQGTLAGNDVVDSGDS